MMTNRSLSVDTSSERIVDLTQPVQDFLSEVDGDGLLNAFVPHATAGLAMMETGAGSERDLEDAIDRLLPRDHPYAHQHGSPGHGADHVLPAFLSSALTLPVWDGALQLGTWQSVVLVDLNRDNPRRTVHLSFLSA